MKTNLMVETVVQRMKRSFVSFPHVAPLLERMHNLLQRNCAEDEPENIFLLGESGVGKSRILKKFRNDFPPVHHEEYTEIPVLYVTVPSNGNARALASAMLLELGSPFWNKGTIKQLTQQLLTLLKACRVRIILLDEVNHLVDKGGIKTHHYTADWLKELIDKAELPMVMAGIPRASRLLSTNDQLRSRFREVISIKPFSIETAEGVTEFRQVLKTFSQMVTGVEMVDITKGNLPQRILFATHGYLRDIRRLLVRAVEIAFKNKSLKIKITTLADAFRQVIYAEAPDDRNPFCNVFTKVPLTKPNEPFCPREE